MPMTGNNHPAQTNDNQAIYEILSKILEKWREDPQSSISPQRVNLADSKQKANRAIPHSERFQDDQIIRETVILTPEEFLVSPQAHASPVNEIPETQCVTVEKEDIPETQRSFHKRDEDVPKTVVQTLATVNSESSSEAPKENLIPETIVFSTQKNLDTNITPEQGAGTVSSTVEKKEAKRESKPEKPDNNQVPETIIYKNKKLKK